MKRRILIGEDDPSVLKMTKARLEHEGYDVLTADDGEMVLTCAKAAGPIHLILLDVRLPKRNGYDVCRQLKAQAGTSRIPVIVFSATEAEERRLANRCIEAGATDWLKKPFLSAQLMDKIHRALNQVIGERGEGRGGGGWHRSRGFCWWTMSRASSRW